MELLAQEEFTRDVVFGKAMEQVVVDFNQSNAYTTLLATEHDAGYDTGYE